MSLWCSHSKSCHSQENLFILISSTSTVFCFCVIAAVSNPYIIAGCTTAFFIKPLIYTGALLSHSIPIFFLHRFHPACSLPPSIYDCGTKCSNSTTSITSFPCLPSCCLFMSTLSVFFLTSSSSFKGDHPSLQCKLYSPPLSLPTRLPLPPSPTPPIPKSTLTRNMAEHR